MYAQELNEAALLARLRRVCQKDHSGKCQVDDKVHELWVSFATEKTERVALAKTLAATNFNKAGHYQLGIPYS